MQEVFSQEMAHLSTLSAIQTSLLLILTACMPVLMI